ncbi:CopD family protein [Siccirubricoccus deserti]
MLLAATGLHQAGASFWLGGLPGLLGALRLTPASARLVGRRYSWLAAFGVGLILLGVGGFWLGYIGEAEAVYGTAYGAMAATKLVLLVLLLALGAEISCCCTGCRRSRTGWPGSAASSRRRWRWGWRCWPSPPPSPRSRRRPTCRTTGSPGPRSPSASPRLATLLLPEPRGSGDPLAAGGARQRMAAAPSGAAAAGLYPGRGAAAAAQRPGYRLERVQPPLGRGDGASGGAGGAAGRDRAGAAGAALAAGLSRPGRLHPAPLGPRGLAARRDRAGGKPARPGGGAAQAGRAAGGGLRHCRMVGAAVARPSRAAPEPAALRLPPPCWPAACCCWRIPMRSPTRRKPCWWSCRTCRWRCWRWSAAAPASPSCAGRNRWRAARAGSGPGRWH